MGVNTFAAIDIGSYELMMKIYTLPGGGGRGHLKQIDCIRYRIELGKDTYTSGKIRYEKINELCEQLLRFREIMDSYKVAAYRICTSSAIRETDNVELLLEQIRTRTGMKAEVLSNSEQRFLEYKAIATKQQAFHKIIQTRTAIADIGGGSLQMSFFDKDRLISTQNMRLGAVRIKQALEESSYRSAKYISMMNEFLKNDLEALERLYLQDVQIQNIIVFGEVASHLVQSIGGNAEFCAGSKYLEFYQSIVEQTPEHICEKLDISMGYCDIIRPVMVILHNIIMRTKAEQLWAPGVQLCDGMAYEYAVNRKLLKEQHDFGEDILAAADNIAKRYKCNDTHTKRVREYAVTIFDAMKKLHGMGKRERLLLEIICKLHDCGKYVSLAYAPQSSYNIVMSTEIIGLSHLEREIIASTILYNNLEITNQENILLKLGEKAYLTVYKLSAVLRLANVLDYSHKQKIEHVKAVLKERSLVVTVEAEEDFSLEQQMFAEKARFFEEVFCVRPKLKVKYHTPEGQ